MRSLPLRAALAASTLLLPTGCFRLFAGDTTAEFKPPRRLVPSDVALPAGYRIEVVATDLTYPTSVTFDGQGTPYVTEAGYFSGLNYASPNPLTPEPDDEAITGAFVPFGTRTEPGQVIRGQVPCSGAVFRLALDSTDAGAPVTHLRPEAPWPRGAPLSPGAPPPCSQPRPKRPGAVVDPRPP